MALPKLSDLVTYSGRLFNSNDWDANAQSVINFLTTNYDSNFADCTANYFFGDISNCTGAPTFDLNLIAGEDIAIGMAVRLASGAAYLATNVSAAGITNFIGLSSTAALTGEIVTINRTISESLTGLSTNSDYFIGVAGAITSSKPATYAKCIGYATSTTQLVLQPLAESDNTFYKVNATTSVSTPSIITASGALGITPASGSNLNISLNATGDFVVNSTLIYGDTSALTVGFGTASPLATVDVQGGAFSGNYFSSRYNSTNFAVCFASLQSNGNPYIGFNTKQVSGSDTINYDRTGTVASILHSSSTDTLKFRVAASGTSGNPINWTTAMTITDSGPVGIGTTSPGYLLELRKDVNGLGPTFFINNGAGNTNTSAQILFQNGGTGIQAAIVSARQGSGAASLDLQTGATLTSRVFIDQNGLVGIGTATPGSILAVKGGGTQATLRAGTITSIFDTSGTCYLNLQSGTASNAGITFGDSDNDDQGYLVYENSNDRFFLQANAGILTYFTSTGVGVNMVPVRALDVTGTFGVTGAATLLSTLAVTGDVYTVTWTDYAASSTISGFSSVGTKVIYYQKLGRMVHCMFFLSGTSNATSCTFTLPYNAVDISSGAQFSLGRTMDNSVEGVPGCGNINLSGVVALYKTTYGVDAFTASGLKIITGQFFFQTAS